MSRTAATATHLIEAVMVGGRVKRVDLCESQGGQWVTIRHGITQQDASAFGFNLAAPAVLAVFGKGPARPA